MPASGTVLRADTIPVGSEIWTYDEDGDQVWMQAQVCRQENTSLTIRRKSTGELEIDLVRSSKQRGNFFLCKPLFIVCLPLRRYTKRHTSIDYVHLLRAV